MCCVWYFCLFVKEKGWVKKFRSNTKVCGFEQINLLNLVEQTQKEKYDTSVWSVPYFLCYNKHLVFPLDPYFDTKMFSTELFKGSFKVLKRALKNFLKFFAQVGVFKGLLFFVSHWIMSLSSKSVVFFWKHYNFTSVISM